MYVKHFEYTRDGEKVSVPYIEIPEFLSHEECDVLVNYFETHLDLKRTEKIIDYFQGRTIWYSRIQSDHPAKHIIRNSREATIEILKKVFAREELYSDHMGLVKWAENFPMDPHYDNQYLDGSPHPMPWREYAAVTYLNDNYEGGELRFANAEPEVLIKPKKGTLVCFGGGRDYFHGVNGCTGNDRYTMPGWFTSDASKAEQELTFPPIPEGRYFSWNYD